MKDWTQISSAEMKVMDKIWEQDDVVTVPGMVSMLNAEGEEWAYQTIATFLRRLEGKKILSSTKQGRNLCYFPIISKEEYEKMEAQDFIDSKFQGSLKNFLAAFSRQNTLKAEDIKELKKWLEELDA